MEQSRRLETIVAHLVPNPIPSVFSPVTGQVSPLRVVITGAAGNIGYAVAFSAADGGMFGPTQRVILHLLEIEQAKQAAEGVKMELIDGAYPLLVDVVVTTDSAVAFKDVDAVIMVGAFPRQKGMERKDLLAKNFGIFRAQGQAIEKFASRNVKVCVVGNPANTNCLIASKFAPSIPPKNWSALTRLDQNRAVSHIAGRLKVLPGQVKNVIIWGNHSATQYPDCNHAVVLGIEDSAIAVTKLEDKQYLAGDFVTHIQNRGAAVIATRGLSSAQSAARAITCHMRDWFLGTSKGELVSMAVLSDGSYGIPKDLVFSFPVSISGGQYTIVQGLEWDEAGRKRIKITTDELLEEKETVLGLLHG